MSIGSATDIAGKNVAPYLTAVVPDHRAGADTSRPRLAYEDVRRQDRGREVVRRVDDLTDTEVDGDAPDRVGLLPRVAVLVHQVVEHVPQGVARRGREVVGGPARRGVGAEAGRRERRARRGVRGRDGDLEPHVAQPALGGLARADVEARSEDRANLYRGPARLAVALREVRVARREQRALLPDGEQDPRAGDHLPDVHVAAVLSRRLRAQAPARDRLGRRDGAPPARGAGAAPPPPPLPPPP